MNVRRPTHEAGYSWRKWQAPLRQRPFWRSPEGAVGYWLICASIGGLLAVVVR